MERFMAARREEGIPSYVFFLVWQRSFRPRWRGGKGAVFQEIPPETGLKTGDFVK